MAEHTELDKDLRQLEGTLRKLEVEYMQFFAGKLPRPPLDTRRSVEAVLRRYDRAFIQSAVDRFRLTTLQSRFSALAELWDRAVRAREEGRPGPFSRPPRPAPPVEVAEPSVLAPGRDRTLNVATVSDPAREDDRLHALYDSLVEARRAVGTGDALPYHRFVQIVQGQVDRLRQTGGGEVAFRVAVKDGKVAFTARAVKAGDREPDAGS